MKCRLIFSVLAMFLLFQSAALAVTVRDAVFKTKNAGKVVFNHGDHLKQKGLANNCRACHDAIFDLKNKKHYSMADMEKGKSCGACHDGKKAFSSGECVRCHQTKEIIYKVKTTGPTGFSHKSHLATSADCNVCHPSVFAAGTNKRFSMADMKKGKSCGACHDGKKAFSIDRCVTCHPVKEIIFKVRQTGPTLFSHTKHIEAHTCSDCHTRLYPVKRQTRHFSMAQMDKGHSCGACHNGKGAFPLKNCTACHPARELTFEVKDAGNVTFSHKTHLGMYQCGECHVALYAPVRSVTRVSMQEMESGKSCGACHDAKTAFNVKDKCDTCHKM